MPSVFHTHGCCWAFTHKLSYESGSAGMRAQVADLGRHWLSNGCQMFLEQWSLTANMIIYGMVMKVLLLSFRPAFEDKARSRNLEVLFFFNQALGTLAVLVADCSLSTYPILQEAAH